MRTPRRFVGGQKLAREAVDVARMIAYPRVPDVGRSGWSLDDT
jgi:hypothetical protein